MSARYDAVADFYEATFSDAEDPIVSTLLAFASTTRPRRVLDVACGHGRVTRELARRGAAVTGIDLSRALLAKAEAIEAAEPMGIRYLHGDVASAPELEDASFDTVVCNFGLSDIDHLPRTLATVSRVLQPGGVFVFSILHPCFPGAGPVSGSWPSTGRYYDETLWFADGAASSLRQQVGANHRMLSTYVNHLSGAGLPVRMMFEPEPPDEWANTDRHEATRFPVFLIVRADKPQEPKR